MHTSGILRYDENVNDMNFFSAFKFTNKGPHALGGKNANNISIRYRGLHPSFLGRIDLLVCGNSDPGTSGLLSPYSNIQGLYFNEDPEPDDFMYKFQEDLKKIEQQHGISYIRLDYSSDSDFYDALYNLQKFNEDNIKCFATSRSGHFDIIIEAETDSDDATPSAITPPTTANKRSRKKVPSAEKNKETEEK